MNNETEIKMMPKSIAANKSLMAINELPRQGVASELHEIEMSEIGIIHIEKPGAVYVLTEFCGNYNWDAVPGGGGFIGSCRVVVEFQMSKDGGPYNEFHRHCGTWVTNSGSDLVTSKLQLLDSGEYFFRVAHMQKVNNAEPVTFTKFDLTHGMYKITVIY